MSVLDSLKRYTTVVADMGAAMRVEFGGHVEKRR